MLDLPDLKRMAENATSLTDAARELSERDRDYYDSHQLTAEEQATLRKRKQPIVIINRIRRKIDAMVGIEQRGRVDPKALPRNPGDEDAAELATKALRFVEEVERIDIKRSAAFENLLVEGYGGVEVCVEPRRGQLEISIKRLRWEEIFFDPFSREKDFSDAAYLGVIKWMSVDRAMEWVGRFYQGEDLAEMLDSTSPATTGSTYEDRPQGEGFAWTDRRQKRVRVAQMYYLREGVWHLAIFNGRGVFYNEVSPYLDEYGEPTCPMVLMTAYIDRDNNRYGLVRDMIYPQDEINKRRSKLLHSLNMRQTIGMKGAVNSVAAMKRELASPDGHVEINPEVMEEASRVGMRPFEVVPNSDQTMGQFNLLTEAKSEIDMLGPNASLLGQLEGNQSGRAIMAQQQAGLAELAPIYDSLSDWTVRLYRQVWAAIKQFWDGPRWIRVTEDEGAQIFIGVNQMQMTPMGPQIVNNVGEIDVDIMIDQSPDYASLRSEQFQALTQLAQSGLPIPPQAIIEASDLRDKDKILQALQPPPEAQQVQQNMMQLDMDGKAAKIERDRAAAAKDMASIPQQQANAAKTAAQVPQEHAQAFTARMMAQRAALGF